TAQSRSEITASIVALAGSGTGIRPVMVIAPGDSVSIPISVPSGPERLVAGNAIRVTGKMPGAAEEETSKRILANPTVAPADTSAPIIGVANRSDVISDCPLTGPVRSGPASELLPKIYGFVVDVFASVKLILGFATSTPNVNAPMFTGTASVFVNSTSK